jgi:hypothetical protein
MPDDLLVPSTVRDYGEPTLDELLAEPAVRLLMARDRVDEALVREIANSTRERIRAVAWCSRGGPLQACDLSSAALFEAGLDRLGLGTLATSQAEQGLVHLPNDAARRLAPPNSSGADVLEAYLPTVGNLQQANL